VHQYSGNLNQSWGGVGLNIDANWVDAAVAGTTVPVNYGTNVVGPGSSGFIFTGDMTYWRSGAPAGLKGLGIGHTPMDPPNTMAPRGRATRAWSVQR